VKRKKLEKRIREIADQRGLPIAFKEGGNHTRVQIGDDVTFIPRHREIDEHLARAILKVLEGR
jgi:hypothetical protein